MNEKTSERRYSSVEICRQAEITYRQLDYWTRTGVFGDVSNPVPGSGRQRSFSAGDLERAVAIRTLLDAGVSMQAIRVAIVHRRFDRLLRQLQEAIDVVDGGFGALTAIVPREAELVG